MFNKKEYQKQYYLRNREKALRKRKERYIPSTRILKIKEEIAERVRVYGQKWYQNNKERHAKTGRIWSSNPENKKKRVRYVQKYTQKNKVKVYNYGKNYNKTLNGQFRTTKSRAVVKGYEFLLSFDEFTKLVTSSCIYCGESKKRIGIDRIDNSLGYTKENSAPCCSMCNYMKKNYLKKEFLSHIKKIYEFSKI